MTSYILWGVCVCGVCVGCVWGVCVGCVLTFDHYLFFTKWAGGPKDLKPFLLLQACNPSTWEMQRENRKWSQGDLQLHIELENCLATRDTVQNLIFKNHSREAQLDECAYFSWVFLHDTRHWGLSDLDPVPFNSWLTSASASVRPSLHLVKM